MKQTSGGHIQQMSRTDLISIWRLYIMFHLISYISIFNFLIFNSNLKTQSECMRMVWIWVLSIVHNVCVSSIVVSVLFTSIFLVQRRCLLCWNWVPNANYWIGLYWMAPAKINWKFHYHIILDRGAQTMHSHGNAVLRTAELNRKSRETDFFSEGIKMILETEYEDNTYRCSLIFHASTLNAHY